MDLWYRPNAGIVVYNRDHKVLVCERLDIPGSWQFPQGGIEEGETIAQAALRELQEETSLISVAHVISLTKPARYTFPPQIISSMKKRGFNNAGQDIYWSLFLLKGNDDEINLNTKEPEFKNYRWVNIEEAYDLCVDFKKTAYRIAIEEFSKYIKG